MNIHRSSRVRAKRSILRRWLAKTMQASHSPNDSRPLLCERLERRYAMHGMAWFAESTEDFRYIEAEGEDADSGFSFAQVRTWQAVYQASARPEPKYFDSRATGEASAFDASLEDMFNDPCDRPHGGKAEGEAPDSMFYRGLSGGGSVYDQISTKPLPKIIDWTPPKIDLSKSNPVGQHEANSSVNTTTSNIANDAAIQTHVTVLTGASTMGTAPTALATPRLIDFTTGSRGLVTTQSTSVSATARNPFSPSASMVNRADASPSLTNTNSQVTAIVSPVSQVSRSTTSTTTASSLSNTDNDASVTIGNSWQNDRPGTSADRSTKSERKTEGLQSELRAVIEKLANDQAAGKAGLNSSVRTNGSIGSRDTEQLLSSNRQRKLFDDGMLELAATNEQLSTSMVLVDGVVDMTGQAQHRSQLIASLELNREFDLAGQSVQSFKSVIDPTTRLYDASLADEDIENWNEQFSASADLSSKPVAAESTIWQRSILPLGFLAIGSLLIRSRKKYRPTKSSQ